jgi:hypothetical protein
MMMMMMMTLDDGDDVHDDNNKCGKNEKEVDGDGITNLITLNIMKNKINNKPSSLI